MPAALADAEPAPPLQPALLLVAAPGVQAQSWAASLGRALLRAGWPAADLVPCHLLVRETVRLAPQVVVAVGDGQDEALLAALGLLAQSQAVPVLWLGPIDPPAPVGRWVDSQVMAVLPTAARPGPSTLPGLLAALQLALARFAREQGQGQALQATLARLDERKWVDRAKGMLMDHLQLKEHDAFTLLRAASMQANLRVGEVSRGVVEAAQAAEAVNLAGQLRMLSQRCMRCLCLRAGASPRPQVDKDLADTLHKLQAHLDHLAGLPGVGQAQGALDATLQAWQALRPQVLALAATPVVGALADAPGAQTRLLQADHLAEALLHGADALTAQLQTLSGRPLLRIVNLCGRQRMLAQRLAKQALLAGLLPAAEAAGQAAAAAETVREFEATLLMLEQAPLATEAIRAALAQARGQWQRLLDGLRRCSGPDAAAGRSALARESDALLAGFDQLTSLYEHSLQVLIG